MATDEREFLRAMQAGETQRRGGSHWNPERGRFEGFPRDVGAELGIHPKRVAYLCGKWSDRGWYDWGTSVDLGWLTDVGLAVQP